MLRNQRPATRRSCRDAPPRSVERNRQRRKFGTVSRAEASGERTGFMKRRLLFASVLCCAMTAVFAKAQPDPIPERALVNAVEKDDRATVLALLNRGADINKVWINDTPLETAIFKQNVEMVTFLLDKGARIKPGDLADAAHGAQGDKARALTIVNLLIAKGADVRAESAKALREAVNADNLEVFRLLLSKG